MFLVRSGAIEGYDRMVTEFGENPVTLLARHGLSLAQLRDPDTYVSYAAVAELLEQTAMVCRSPLFGLALAQRQTSAVLGELTLSLAQQPTVGDALEVVEKYLYLHARGAHLIGPQDRGDRVLMELVIHTDSPGSQAQLMQMSVGQLANFVTETLALQRPDFQLALRQARPEHDDRKLPAAIRRRVVFGAPADGILLPKSWLARRPHYDEQAVRSHFHDYLRTLQLRYPNNIHDQVKDIIGQLLPSGECRLERVASTLNLHPRVLQKRLRAEGSSYVKLLQETRMDIARQHLRLGTLSITDLALNLGYAEAAVFSRKFKASMGMSPRAWQRQQQEAL